MAVVPNNVGPGELALLPPYCVDTEAFMYGPEGSPRQSPRAAGWVAKMGRSFWAMHHYCWGLVNLNRLRTGRAETNNKRFFAQQIANEYGYVIKNATPNFILLPEIWSRIGEALILAGDFGGAMEAFAKARQIKPDYPPAYTQWADFLMRYGKNADAKQLVAAGLFHSPGSAELQALYRKLGGDPASLPLAKPAAAADSPATVVAPPTPPAAAELAASGASR